jgi:hypothetical protein
MIHQNGNGPDMVQDRVFGNTFHQDLRPGFGGGIIREGGNRNPGGNSEKNAKTET